ncbi:MAG: hypothetical protein ACOH2A_10625 [Sphingobacteriaceae bacterium]
MANVTEKDIINHLKEKIKFHQSESKKIETLLNAFTGNSPQKQKQAKQEAVTEVLEAPVNNNIARKNKTVKKTVKTAKVLAIPAVYKSDLSWNSKIAFAINALGEGVFNEDIASKIAELEPGLDAAKVTKQISGLLSVLKAKGSLKAERTGKKDKYSLAN